MVSVSYGIISNIPGTVNKFTTLVSIYVYISVLRGLEQPSKMRTYEDNDQEQLATPMVIKRRSGESPKSMEGLI